MLDNEVSTVTMSNLSGEGVGEVKSAACEKLLEFRMNNKVETVTGGNSQLRREEEYLRGPYVA